MSINGNKMKLFKQSYIFSSNVKISEQTMKPPDSEFTVEGYVVGSLGENLTMLEPIRKNRKARSLDC